MLKTYKSKLNSEKFDFITFVPPSTSGNLLKNFATKISEQLHIPFSDNIIKTRITAEQKSFNNAWGKYANVKDAFDVKNRDEFKGKNILLIDDIYDTGITIKELGKLCTSIGARKLVPLVIAKTVGGDLA
jgi:ATP-dependent DNA helicase RecQ